MQAEIQPMMKMNVNGCSVTLAFVERPKDGVIENIQSILSKAYDERVENDLKKIVEQKNIHI